MLSFIVSKRSSDGMKRNPGFARITTPDFAAFHPGSLSNEARVWRLSAYHGYSLIRADTIAGASIISLPAYCSIGKSSVVNMSCLINFP